MELANKVSLLLGPTKCKASTMCKIQNFSLTQFLREINFGEFRKSKIDVLAILGVLKQFQTSENAKNH